MLYGIPEVKPPVVTIQVRMVKTTKATLDGGCTTIEYQEGQEYDLPEWLAQAFFSGGEGDPAEAHAVESEPVADTGEPNPATRKVKQRRRAS